MFVLRAVIALLRAVPESGRTIVARDKPCQERVTARNLLKMLCDSHARRFGEGAAANLRDSAALESISCPVTG
jgi:hypothetical protein